MVAKHTAAKTMAAKNTSTEKGNGFQSMPSKPKGKKKDSPPSKFPSKAPTVAKSAGASKLSPVKSKAKLKGGRDAGIPKQVSKRMVRRMALFCGIPTFLGLVSFPTSYFMLQQGIELPNVAVLLVSLGCLGLGVLGLSYGVLSASWDEERLGNALGWSEFQLNFGRMVEGWKEARDRSKL
jgi:Photosynthesis affected mutant 68